MVLYHLFEKFDQIRLTKSGLKSLAKGLAAKDKGKTNYGNVDSVEKHFNNQ